MKKTVSIVLLLAILCMLVGCQGTAATQPKKPTTAGPNNSVPSTAGNAVFVYENGFGGSFTITVSPNGSFSYYEGMLSSHLGFGIWTLSGNLLTLTESMSRYDASADAVVKVDYTYCFLYQNNTLFFMADQSDRFMYVKLEDGAAFYPLNMEDPQPICYSVNFEAMYLYGGSGYPNLSTEPQWATSKEQLHDFLEIHGAGALFYAKVAAYDEAFFADNSIIILQFGEGSGSIRHKVRDVVVIPSADDASTVIQPTVERIIPAVGTDDCAWWYIFIEVSKEYGKDHFQIAAPMIENRNFSDSDTLYTVEVVDHFNLLKEPLKRQYKVGDTVTVTLNFRSGPSTGIVLNGEYIGADANSKVTFTMPAQDSILYTATNGAIMPQLSEKFSFEITWGFDGYYNSETGLLKNGHNAELNQDCVTNLTLSHEQLQEIYILLHSVHIYDLPSEIRENMTLVEPSYDLKLTINENGVSKSIVILSPFHPETAMWDYYEELRVVYYKIVNEYIRASEAYRSLPPNTNLYE